MTTKLTLSISGKTVEKAKRVSRKRGKSISKMVEEYFNSISEKEEQEETAVDKTMKILKGRITRPGVNWKEAKEEQLVKKYGL